MKRILSVILAAAMLFAMIPAVAAADTQAEEETVVYSPNYVFSVSAVGSTSSPVSVADYTDYSQINRDVSSGAWRYVGRYGSTNSTMSLISTSASFLQYSSESVDPVTPNALVFMIKVDKSGVYDTGAKLYPNKYCGLVDMYMIHKDDAANNNYILTTMEGISDMLADAKNEADAIVKHVYSEDTNNNSNTNLVVKEYAKTVNLEKGEYYLIFQIGNGGALSNHNKKRTFAQIGSFTLTCKGTITASADKTEIGAGETATVSAVVTDGEGAASDSTVSYSSSDENVATVSGSTVTAVAEGEAKIKASATIDGVEVTDTVTIKVSPKQVSVGTDIDGTFSVQQWDMGADVTVTAPENTGKVFRHWVLGTETNGIPVSSSASYTFKAVTNTYLTAVYSDVAEEGAKVVEFYLENGGYIGNKVADNAGKVTLPDVPSITGYVFSAWKTDAKTEFTKDTIVKDLLTKVVATFNAAQISEGVSYGDKVEKKDSSAKLWKRDGKVVAYGTEYTYYVWTDSEIEAVDGTKPNEPIIVLDVVSKDGARMIEYDANGFDIVEAGILFGNGENMTVDSCMYKAKSSRNSAHGQFTAKPANDEYTAARGYVVYKDGNDYKVVYSD